MYQMLEKVWFTSTKLLWFTFVGMIYSVSFLQRIYFCFKKATDVFGRQFNVSI